ncbi:MAG: PTS sugar transporter subunit IIA [Desulfobacterales bacterium]|nr:PTS sugar transporter subunit IIA [Desulfobacterales bacterium]
MQLDLEEFAECLDIPQTTVERWIRQGRIPVRRKGNKCEFSQSLIEKWAETNHLKFVMPGMGEETEASGQEKEQEQAADDLQTVMRRGGVFYDIEGESVEDVLWAVVNRVPYFDTPEKKKSLYESLKAREAMMSTGIGKGVAIPHPRTPMTETDGPAFITTCFLKSPVDYRAIDKKPVFVLFLLVSTSAQLHLHLLAQLSFCLRNEAFLQLLNQYPAPEELYAKIAELSERIET